VSSQPQHRDPRKVILEGDFADWPVKPKKDNETGAFVLSTAQWTDLLGWLMFDLPPQARTDSFEPTFRSVFSYFVRRGRDAFFESL